MDNISRGLNESNDLSISDLSEESLSTSLLLLSSSQIFTESYTIAVASSAWRTFAFSLNDVISFVLRRFRFFELRKGRSKKGKLTSRIKCEKVS